jgi:hypothetical protein
MKTTQEIVTEFDRISTHEELHQVLALVSDGAPGLAPEALGEPDDTKALREAVAELWRDAADEPDRDVLSKRHDEESDVRGLLYPWAEMLAGKTDRVN